MIDNELVGPLLEEVKESMKSAENILWKEKSKSKVYILYIYIYIYIVNGRGLRKVGNSSSDPYVVDKVKEKDMLETLSLSTARKSFKSAMINLYVYI